MLVSFAVAGLPNLANLDYVNRVNRAIDHIQRNLGSPLNLDDIAKVACFSPFHFHRIFKTLVGETLNAFIKRVRLERALYLLAHRDSPALTDVALACGFSSSSDFSRSFRKHFGVPPSAFDLEAYRKSQRKQLQDSVPPDQRHLLEGLPPGKNPDGFEAKLFTAPARRVAYLRVTQPFEEGRVTDAAEQMVNWARARGLAGGQWLGYMWEDPEIVALDRCRYDVGLEVPADFQPDSDFISVIDFPQMKLASIDIAGAIDLEQRAIDWLYHTWLPSSGYVPDHQPGFEAWNGEPFAHGDRHFELKVQLAVVPAGEPL